MQSHEEKMKKVWEFKTNISVSCAFQVSSNSSRTVSPISAAGWWPLTGGLCLWLTSCFAMHCLMWSSQASWHNSRASIATPEGQKDPEVLWEEHIHPVGRATMKTCISEVPDECLCLSLWLLNHKCLNVNWRMWQEGMLLSATVLAIGKFPYTIFKSQIFQIPKLMFLPILLHCSHDPLPATGKMNNNHLSPCLKGSSYQLFPPLNTRCRNRILK